MQRIRTHLRKGQRYLYHGTQEDCLIGIARHGLLSRRRSGVSSIWTEAEYRGSDTIFLAETEDSAMNWACGELCQEDENPDCHPFVVRIRVDKLPKNCKLEPDILPPRGSGDEPFVVYGSWMARCDKIPPDAIEVAGRDGWFPIREAISE